MRKFRRWLVLFALPFAMALAAENVLFTPEPGSSGIWSVSLRMPGRKAAANIPVPIERIAGRKILLAAEIEQENISKKPNHWNGVKLMLVASYADGKTGYLQAENSSGSLPWTPHAVAVTVPADIRSARIDLALEEVSGTARFRNVRIVEDIPIDYRGYRLTGATDRENGEYRAGETMGFTFSLSRDGRPAAGFLRLACAGDDGKSKVLYKQADADGTVRVERSLDRPGFVMVKATLLTPHGLPAQNGGRNIQYGLGGGVEPEALKQGTPDPADFDVYWKKQLEALAAVPPKLLEKKLVKESNQCFVYDVKISCVGKRPVSGYLSIPKGAGPKSLPLRVWYEGYGVSSAPIRENPAEITFSVNAHGIENGRELAYYKELEQGELHNYGLRAAGNQKPESSYFNNMILRDLRALEFARSLPEWDGSTLYLAGGSQGAFQVVAVAALSDGVTGCFIRVPWFCDLGGIALGRVESTFRPQPAPGLAYFDTVNFAKRVRAPVEIEAGLTDWVCPPSGVWVLYNNLNCPAKLTMFQGLDHGGYPAYDQRTTPKTVYHKSSRRQ